MSEHDIVIDFNGAKRRVRVPGNRLLREFIRDDLGYTGTKVGCEDGMCGVCSVLVDGHALKSCLALAVEMDGRSITTIEGLADGDELHPVQQAMIDNFGFQCGFCTPGAIMTMVDLLGGDTQYDEETAREALVGNICRCTGYTAIVNSFLAAQREAAAANPVEV
jgi:carbon-monoxide dehydrogenase small subunit